MLLFSGILTGVINAMAGGGSFLTVPILMALGLPATVVNGTIRVGVFMQNVAAVWAFRRHDALDLGLTLRLLAPTALGAAAGGQLAVHLDSAVLKPLFGITLMAWGVILLVKPGRFLRPPDQPRPLTPTAYVLAALVGAYGGFIQVGVGFPFIALLVLYLGYPAVNANAAKVALILAYTVVVLPMFAFAGQVAWVEGIFLAGGMMAGGWIGARWQIKSGANIVRWFVIVMVLVSGCAMLLP